MNASDLSLILFGALVLVVLLIETIGRAIFERRIERHRENYERMRDTQERAHPEEQAHPESEWYKASKKVLDAPWRQE